MEIKSVILVADEPDAYGNVFTRESLIEAVQNAGKIPVTWGTGGPTIGEVTTFKLVDGRLIVAFDVSKGE